MPKSFIEEDYNALKIFHDKITEACILALHEDDQKKALSNLIRDIFDADHDYTSFVINYPI